MRKTLVYSAAAVLLSSLPSLANASTFTFGFSGPGVSGNINLTYGPATDATYHQAYEVTGISGTITDTNIVGIVNAPIFQLVPINHATPEPGNALTPADFSKYAVASGTMDGSLSFDNLFYPAGSPPTATSYPFGGGFLDIYGLLFTLGNGDVVNLWSNGYAPPNFTLDYGFAIATSARTLDYVGGGVEPTPEPGTIVLMATGLSTLVIGRRRSLFARS